MVAKRIIPCLDVNGNSTVKGIRFNNLKIIGDPVLMGINYAIAGADELVYLDISATNEGRKTFVDLVKDIARVINIPFTVGGGISCFKEAAEMLNAGADKIAINSAALSNPQLIKEISSVFGSQFVVVAIDAIQINGCWMVMSRGGRIPAGRELLDWALESQDLGAGEILFTSIDNDGTKEGFACDKIAQLSSSLSIPVIASGGAGKAEHFERVFKEGKADAALAASIFHNGEISIKDLKSNLLNSGLNIRI